MRIRKLIRFLKLQYKIKKKYSEYYIYENNLVKTKKLYTKILKLNFI